MRRIGIFGIAILASVFAGCANPAKDKPEAVVAEPTAVGTASSDGAVFKLTDASKLEFTGSKVTGSHEGGFRDFSGEIVLVYGDPQRSSVRISIDTTSIWSDNEKLTGHLKSADFFEVETHPTASFASTEIRREGDAYVIVGNLDLHGVEKSISFPATIGVDGERVTAQAEFFIRRFDFGILFKGPTDNLIRDEVVIRFDLEARPAA